MHHACQHHACQPPISHSQICILLPQALSSLFELPLLLSGRQGDLAEQQMMDLDLDER
jgi:hypothetical protein